MEKKYKINVLDAVYFVRVSWNQVSENTIKIFFEKLAHIWNVKKMMRISPYQKKLYVKKCLK